jgi:phage terminase large subunit
VTEADIVLPPKLVPVFEGEARIRGAWGGRGSAKTRTFAKMTAVRGYMWSQAGISGQLLCAREHLNSLDESSMEEVKAAIRSEPWLNDYYEIGQKYIRTRCGRIEYTFAGLRHNVDSIKSKARILLCWVDEAEAVSETAWRKLMPTVREEGSEVWVTWNPENKRSATHKRFRENPPEGAKIVEMNYRDNPWFPAVLEAERLEDYHKRPETYGHVWEGEFLEHAEGAYYLTEMRAVKESGRITEVKYRPELPVITAWDLGIGDSTAIWCCQFAAQEVHLIDYFEHSGVGLDHYVRWLKDKDYIYDTHVLPHDVEVRELGSGMSRLETLQQLGLHNITIAPKLRVDDGIQQVRSFLSRCWFDKENCENGIEAMRAYHREYSDSRMTYNERPHHDWASHGADAFRYLAVGAPGSQRTGWDKPVKRRIRGRVA